ncbi:MAG: hypothetical protein OXC46_04955 [Thaumarchaeota archaeon]|nr:hypothetical protein [Nitrososphaerota archaeon]
MPKTKCPKCNSVNVTKILYGYVTGDALEKLEKQKNVVLGGCCVSSFDADRICNSCDHGWRTDRGHALCMCKYCEKELFSDSKQKITK